MPWAIAGAAGLALVVVLLSGRRSGPPSHPEPRPQATALGETVRPASFFADNPRVQRTYQRARQIPATLDALYCYCRCKEELGHRSLLACFQSEHGAGCDICLEEAELAYELVARGQSIGAIRQQIDLAFQR